MIALTAVAGVWWWERRSVPRWALVRRWWWWSCAGGYTGRRVTQRAYSTLYLPVTVYLKDHAAGTAWSWAAANWHSNWDTWTAWWTTSGWGFRSGKRPNFIVIDKNRYAEWIPQYERREPETYRYIRGMMDGEFHQVLENGAYQVYARNGL